MKKYNYVNYKKLQEPKVERKLSSIKLNKFDLYQAANFEILNQYVILHDLKADKMLKVFDLYSGDLKASFGGKGQGPDEFISIAQIIPSNKEDSFFWIYDIVTRSIKMFNLEKIIKGNFYPDKIIFIQSEKSGVPARLIFNDKDKIFGLGLFPKNRICVFDENGNYIKGIGVLPFNTRDKRFLVQHSQGFIGNIILRKKGKEIYVATRYGSIIEKYDINGNLISTLYGPEIFFPEYDIVPAGESYTMTYNKKTRFGYIDIFYNEKNDKIYLLYSGRYKYNRQNRENLRANYGRVIYVMDSNSTLIEKIELDKDIFKMIVSDEGNLIYGLNDTELLKFEILQK